MSDRKTTTENGSLSTENLARTTGLESPFVFADEAARYLKISVRALEHFRSNGEGPAYRKHGGRVVYHRDDLDLWSERRRFRSSSERDTS